MAKSAETKRSSLSEKLSKEKASTENNENNINVKEIEGVNGGGPSYEELASMVSFLARQVKELKESRNIEPASTRTEELLEAIANRKSDKEVIVIHNCELLGGLTTHLELTGLSIDFRHVGEQRVLSWQQFEECVSKYHSFFEKGIIKLGADYRDLAEKYGLPYDAVQDSVHSLNSRDIEKLPSLSVHELEALVESLNDRDKDTLMSYWLGKSYERVDGFYDRYKIETLNRLSNKGVFDTLILVMNGEH